MVLDRETAMNRQKYLGAGSEHKQSSIGKTGPRFSCDAADNIISIKLIGGQDEGTCNDNFVLGLLRAVRVTTNYRKECGNFDLI